MPETIIAIGSFIASTAAAASAAIASLSILGKTLLYVGLSIGTSLLQAALQKKPSQPSPEDVQQSARQGIQPRVRHYGRVKTSGPWLFAGTNEGHFHKVIALAHGEISSVETLWLDDNSWTVAGLEAESGGNLASPNESIWSSFMTTGDAKYDTTLQIQYTLGGTSPAAFPDLVSAFPEYTAAHVGKGIALLYAKQFAVSDKDYFNTFPNGINGVYLATLFGAKVLNPKTGVTEWSDNAAAVVLDYAKHADGMRLPTGIFETPMAQQMWEDAFDDCAAAIDLDAGGTEARYRIWGSYTLQERPADVIGRMLAVCDGSLVPTSDGGVGLKIGKWYEPTVVLTEDDITGVSELTRGVDSEQRPNTIRAQFTDPDNHQSADADPWVDAADISARGPEVRDISLLMSPSHTQTRRRMKQEFYRSNPDWTGGFTFNKAGLAILGEQLIRVQIADFGLDEVFEVQTLDFTFGEGGIIEGCSASLISMPEAAWAWDETTEEGVAPVADEATEGTTISEPGNFDATIVGGVAPYATLEWDAVSASLRVEARYKATADSEWLPIGVADGATEAQSPTLTDGVEYEFQVRAISSTGRASDWTTSVDRTVQSDGTAPDVVSSVSGSSPGAGEVNITWTNPNSANFDRVVIKRWTADVEGSAVEVSGSPIYGAPSLAGASGETGLAAGDYYYWVYAANASGVESTGVATGAITVI